MEFKVGDKVIYNRDISPYQFVLINHINPGAQNIRRDGFGGEIDGRGERLDPAGAKAKFLGVSLNGGYWAITTPQGRQAGIIYDYELENGTFILYKEPKMEFKVGDKVTHKNNISPILVLINHKSGGYDTGYWEINTQEGNLPAGIIYDSELENGTFILYKEPEPKMEFKVGDKVTIKSCVIIHTISEIKGEFVKSSVHSWYHIDDLEKVEQPFKVGQTVQFMNELGVYEDVVIKDAPLRHNGPYVVKRTSNYWVKGKDLRIKE